MNNKFKLFVTDMDGTLLNSEGKISDETKNAIDLLKKNNVKIIIATGRLDSTVKPFYKQLNLDLPVISCNGAMIRHPFTKEVFYLNPLDRKNFLKLINTCFLFCKDLLVYGENTIFYTTECAPVKRLKFLNTKLAKDEQALIKELKSFEELLDLDETLVKILAINEDTEKLNSLLKKLSDFEDISAYKSSVEFVDIMSKGTSKGDALEKFAKQNSISQEEIFSFGDNHNDKSLIEFAGLGVAMGNAEEDIKNIADYITLTNDENGVAHIIKKYFQ